MATPPQHSGASALDQADRPDSPFGLAVALSSAASKVGFDWESPSPVYEAVRAELVELRAAQDGGIEAEMHHELGDVLLAACNLARHLSVNPETALADAAARFELRFRHMEASASREDVRLQDLRSSQLQDRWQAAKRALTRGGGA